VKLNLVHAGSSEVVLPLISDGQRNPIFARLAGQLPESGDFYSPPKRPDLQIALCFRRFRTVRLT
jgi:hypothetical protein